MICKQCSLAADVYKELMPHYFQNVYTFTDAIQGISVTVTAGDALSRVCQHLHQQCPGKIKNYTYCDCQHQIGMDLISKESAEARRRRH